MAELWEWRGTDRYGVTKVYQTRMPTIASESEMLNHLRTSFHGLKISSIRRCEDREFKPAPPGVQVESHAYQYGIWDEVKRQLGIEPELKQSLAERFRAERLRQLAGAPARHTYVPVRNRIRPLVRG